MKDKIEDELLEALVYAKFVKQKLLLVGEMIGNGVGARNTSLAISKMQDVQSIALIALRDIIQNKES